MSTNRSIYACLLAICAVAVSLPAWSQGLTVSSPTAVSASGAGGATTVSSIAVDLRIGGLVGISTGTQFRVQFCDAAGNNIGTEITVATNAAGRPNEGNRLTIPVPAAAAGLGNCVVIRVPPDGTGTDIAAKLQWIAGSGKVKAQVVEMKIPGPPGFGPQRWEFEIPGPDPVDDNDLILDGSPFGLIASGIDLNYESLGGGDFLLRIFGNDSFIRLADGSYMFFPDASEFGTMEIVPGLDSGVFDFFAIGLSGVWAYDAPSDTTRARSSDSTAFSAAVLRVVPEPATWLLLLIALAALGRQDACRRKIGMAR